MCDKTVQKIANMSEILCEGLNSVVQWMEHLLIDTQVTSPSMPP